MRTLRGTGIGCPEEIKIEVHFISRKMKRPIVGSTIPLLAGQGFIRPYTVL